MARRADQKVAPSLLWLLAGGFLLAATLSVMVAQFRSTPFRETPRLLASDYYENANSLRGNIYQLEGTILNALAWDPQRGRLFSILVVDSNEARPLPILVPPQLQQINIQKNQRYRLRARVDDSGILAVEEIQKS